MLADPKWDYNTVESFIAWLELQPPETTYDYWDCGDCVGTRYLKSKGFTYESYPKLFNNIGTRVFICDGRAPGSDDKPWTYGQALQRARQALAARS